MAETALTAKPTPSMIGVIARKEIVEVVRDGRFKWTAAIMALLLLTALLAGWQRFAAYNEIQTAAQAATNQQWLKQGDKNPHSAAHYGNYAFKQAGPLSFFDVGIANYTGNLLFMEAHKQNLAISRPANDLSAVSRFGDLDGAMILQVLMPLLIIFLGFTAFAGERERGTLRQLMSLGVARGDLLWGKALGIGAAVMLVVVPCVLAAAAILSWAGIPDTADAFWGRTAIMSLSYAGYGFVFLFLTLAVSALAANPRSALITLVGFWAFASFLAPKAVSEVSAMIRPSPSYGQFEAAMKADQVRGLGGPPPAARVGMYLKELLRKYNVTTVAELPVYWPAMSMQKLEELDHLVFDKHYNALTEAYAAQRRIQDAFGVVAPLMPLKSVSMALAGTDLMHHVAFTRAAEQQRRLMVEKMNGYLSQAAVDLNGSYNSSNYMVADEKVFSIVPPFSYAQPTLSEILHEHWTNFVLLMAWMLAALAFAITAVNRMNAEVR